MEFSDNHPIFLQIADHICEKIMSDQWKAGDKVPSVREIAVLTEVNPNTAMRAFTHLQEQEIIFNKRGIGYFVADDGKEKARHLKRKAFLEKEAPLFFKSMDILGITPEEIVALYKTYKAKK